MQKWLKRKAAALAVLVAASSACADTLMVTTNADSGAGSLRDAITTAAAAGISENIELQSGIGTITLLSNLPVLGNPNLVSIVGIGDIIGGNAASSAGTLQFGDGSNVLSLTGTQGSDGAFGIPTSTPATAGSVALTVSNNASVNVMANATISGGNGGGDTNGDPSNPGDSSGASAISFNSVGTLVSAGTLNGGGGGDVSTVGTGGSGAAAVSFTMANASFTNTGTVTGGNGGPGDGLGGNGGSGVQFNAIGSLTNSGAITGGHGGDSMIPQSEYSGPGSGGAGVTFNAGGSLINSGSISGQAGGFDGIDGYGSTGPGVSFAGATATLTNENHGSIAGGVVMGNYANNVTLQIGSSIIGGLNMGTSTASTLTLSDDGSGGTQTYSAAVDTTTFSGSLIKNGPGIWVMDQSMNYTGSTTINAGTLSVDTLANGGTDSEIGDSTNDSSNLVLDGGTLRYTGASATTDRGFTVGGTNGGTLNVTTAGTSLEFDGAVSGGTLTKTGDGTLVLGGTTDNNGLGAIVDGGTLVLGKASSSSPAVHAIGGGGLTVNSGIAQLAGIGGDQIYDTAPVTMTGGTFDLNGQSETIGALSGSAGTVTNSAASTISTLTVTGGGTFGGAIIDGAGRVGLVRAGSNTLELTNANTYTGGTTISGGTLQLGDGITNNGSVTGDITDNAALTFANPSAQNYGGVISGSGSLTVAGPGTLTLTNDNTFSGGTTISGGTLVLGDGTDVAALAGGANSPAVTVNGGALQMLHEASALGSNGGVGDVGTVGVNIIAGNFSTNAGTVQGGNGGHGPGGDDSNGGNGAAGVNALASITLTNTGRIDGGDAGDSDSGDSGNGGNGGAGAIFIGGGTLNNTGLIGGGVGGSTSVGDGGDGGTGVSFTAGGTLTNSGSISGGSGGGGIGTTGSTGGAGVSFMAGGVLTNSGSITGGSGGGGSSSGGSNGAGVTFSNAAGTLTNEDGGTITGGVVMGNYANSVTLQIGSSITGGLNIGTSTGSTLTLTDDGTNLGPQNYSAAVDSTTFSGALIKDGSGTWALDQPMSYTGGTQINAGTLAVTSDAALGSSNNAITISDATLQTNAALTIAQPLAITTGDVAYVNTNGNNSIVSGQISGNGGFIKQGAGTLTLTNTSNSQSGDRIDAGVLSIDSDSELGTAGGALFLNGGTLQTTTNLTSSRQVILQSSINSNIDTDGNTLTLTGVLSESSPGGSLTVLGGGTLELTNANTYTGGTTISGGTLQLGDGSTTNGSVMGNITDNAALTFANPNAQTYGGVISGSGSLTAAGPGTLTLTNVNTFTGGTTVNSGTLVLGDGTDAAALSAATGGVAVTVNSGGTLQVQNNASVTGGTGGGSVGENYGRTGGSGVSVSSGGTLTNAGSIIGGGGGSGSGDINGGGGGMGVNFSSAGTLTNSGSIVGGGGGSDGDTGGGGGGVGVTVSSGGTLANAGSIRGGNGVGGPLYGGNGNTGVNFTAGGTLTNAGSITGGSGGGGIHGGSNGAGVTFSNAAGTLTNEDGGTITGGVVMGNYANSVTLQIGSSITGGLNIGTSTASTLTLTDDGTDLGPQTYSVAVDSTAFFGSLIKGGEGTWILDQPMSFTGDTTVNDGTLELGAGSAADSPVVTVDATGADPTLELLDPTALSTNAELDVLTGPNASSILLDYDGNQTIFSFVIDGIAQPYGVYSASFEPAGDATLFTSDKGFTGTLTVVPEPSMAMMCAMIAAASLSRRRARTSRKTGL